MLAYAALAGAVLLWGLSFPVMKFAVGRLGPFDLGLYRIGFGAVGSLALLAVPGPARIAPAVPAIRRHAGTLVVLSLLVGYGQTFTLTYGMALTPATTASLIPPLNPICTLLLAAWYLGEPVRPRQWLGIGLAVGGVVVLAFRHGTPTWDTVVGPLVLAIAPVSWAVYTVMSKPVLADVRPFELTALTLGGGLVLVLPWAGAEAVRRLGAISGAEWAAVLYLGFGAMTLAYALWSVGLAGIGAGTTGATVLGIPLVGVGASWMFLDEPVGLVVVVAGLLILGGLHLVLAPRHG